MPRGVLYKIALLVLLSPLQPGQLQEEQPTADEGSDVGVAEAFGVIKTLLSTIKSKTNTHIREFRSFRNEVKGDLMSLRANLSSLNDSVSSLNDSVNNLSMRLQEHKQQTAAELAQLQTSLQSSLPTQNQQANARLSRYLQEHLQQMIQIKIWLYQHKRQTKAELAQLQTSLNTSQSSLETKLDHLSFLREDLSSLSDSVSNLSMSLEEHKQQTADDTVPTYTCGGTGGWRRVVYLVMTDPSTTCPSGWQLNGYFQRTCRRPSRGRNTCDSVTFPVSGGEYSRVCGRIKAYQYKETMAFQSYHWGYVTTIDGAYVSGISVTHSSPRQHIWTFAAGASEGNPTWTSVCPCDANGTIHVPPFVGNDYFCESGVNEPWNWSRHYILHSNDPLWDGKNCLSNSTCCSLHNPPYFVKQLPTPTTDDIEARMCLNDYLGTANIAVELVELYVQ